MVVGGRELENWTLVLRQMLYVGQYSSNFLRKQKFEKHSSHGIWQQQDSAGVESYTIRKDN